MALSPTMNVMLRAAEKAAKSLSRDFGEVENLQVSRKGPGDFVSAADTRAEQIIFSELSKVRPDFGFLMEERGEAGVKGAESRWIVDPLDGTSNFLHGIPHWCISIALETKGEIVAGIVYDPIKDEMFRAEKGMGAFLKNRKLRVSGRKDLEVAMLVTGQPARGADTRDQFLREYCHVQTRVPALRRYGAAALDLAYIAAGRFEGFWERNLKPWDTAAGYLLVKEAKGMIEDLDGKGNPIYTGSVIAANADIFPSLKLLIHEARQAKDAA